ncbi:MAG: hypothetical protein ACFFB5_23175 [Promethearchaeota archaeon]
MGVLEDWILILGFSNKMVYYDRIESNSELLNRILSPIESLRKKQQKVFPLSQSESLELIESEKFVQQEIFSYVKAMVFIIESILISDLSRAKYFLDLSLQHLSQHNPNASVFIFHPKALISQKEAVQIALKGYLSAGVNQQIDYFSDLRVILQKLREIA